MYKAGVKLNASPYVIRHIVHTNKWKRPASRAPIILKGVKRGTMPASHYKSLDFTGTNFNVKQKETSKMIASKQDASSMQKQEIQFFN